MLRIVAAGILLCLLVEPLAADEPRLAKGNYLLHVTFDPKDPQWNFNYDVKVLCDGARLSLIVQDDLKEKDQRASELGTRQHRGGFGQRSTDRSVKLAENTAGKKRLLAAQRTLLGRIDNDGVIRFGVTTLYDGELVSLHLKGHSSLGGAKGKAYFLSSEGVVRDGTWYLKNAFSRGESVPGFNGANPLGR